MSGSSQKPLHPERELVRQSRTKENCINAISVCVWLVVLWPDDHHGVKRSVVFGEIVLQSRGALALAERIVDEADQGLAVLMGLVTENVNGKLVRDLLLVEILAGHFYFDRDVLILQDEVDSARVPSVAGRPFFRPDVVKVQLEECAEEVLHVVLVRHCDRGSVVVALRERVREDREPVADRADDGRRVMIVDRGLPCFADA